MLGVLDRERMELEDVAQDLEVAGLGPVEVEPEELPAREQLLDALAAELDLAAALVVDHVADGPGSWLWLAGAAALRVRDGNPGLVVRESGLDS